MNNLKPFPIIGLEIHVELKTTSKMFCQCSADYFGAEPNTHVCPVCLGMPGALPVPNKTAVEWTIMIAKALGCTVPNHTKFDRKHYFYPDLPKGYQISQYDEPIGINGSVSVSFDEHTEKTFRLRRVHLEEDTGKNIHSGEDTLLDFNRSSVPLVEIVTEADFHSSDDVKRFLEELQIIIRTLGVANADMEKGDMRLEPNISVALLAEGTEWDGKTFPPYKVEVKNINSFRYAKAAIDFEIPRQTELLKKGEIPVQETRGYNETKQETVSQRTKEEAADYRYFPEPDIPPMNFTNEYLKHIESQIPELPEMRIKRYRSEFGLRYQDAFVLTRVRKTAELYEEVIKEIGKDSAQKVANLMVNKKVPLDGTTNEVVNQVKVKLQGKQTDMSSLKAAVDKILAENEKVVMDYKSGKQQALMFLLGQVMKEMKGQADAAVVKEQLIASLT